MRPYCFWNWTTSYFKIALHSSAVFCKRFWKYKVPILVISYISYVLVSVLPKFVFTSFCSILRILGFLSLFATYYVLKKTQKIWPFFSFLGKEQIEETHQLINNYVHTKWIAHYLVVQVQFWSCFKVWLKQDFFEMKDFNCNYNLIYPTFFRWLLQFLP